MKNKILSINVDQVGMVYADPDTPIETFVVNGEMAPINWFKKGNQEYNGKYVISVEWEKPL
jgi:hypothetical protein